MTDKYRGLIQRNENLNREIRQSFQQALILLIEKKPFDDITITELCQKAGASRMAFYSNYKSKDMLFEEILLELHRRMLVEIGSPFRTTTTVRWYERFFEMVKDNYVTLHALFNAGFRYRYINIINSLVLHNPNIPSVNKYLRLLWSGGVSNILIYWVDNGMPESVESIAKFCYDAVSSVHALTTSETLLNHSF